MRSRTRPAPRGAGADYGLAAGIVGIGEPVNPAPHALDAAVRALAERHGAKAGRMVRRFADLPDGAFVWTCQSDGRHRLGRIGGPWRYDDSPQARAVGICHVRAAVWAPPAPEVQVPRAVLATFARGGRNFQRIHDRGAELETQRLWQMLVGRPATDDHSSNLPPA